MLSIVDQLLATMIADTPFLNKETTRRARYLLNKIITTGRNRLVLQQSKKLFETIQDSSHIHQGQYRKDNITPYILHLLETAYILISEGIYDFKTLCAAILHDTVEDTKDPLKKERVKKLIKQKYGAMVYRIVDLVSKRKDEAKDAIWERILAEPDMCILWRALVIKYADRIHNMRTLGALSPEDRKRKIDETKKWFPVINKKLKETLQKLWIRRTLKNQSRLKLPTSLQNKINNAIMAYST